MIINKKLWKILIDRDIKKSEKTTCISNFTLNKLNKGENVTIKILEKICKAVDIDRVYYEYCSRPAKELSDKEVVVLKVFKYKDKVLSNIEYVVDNINQNFEFIAQHDFLFLLLLLVNR